MEHLHLRVKWIKKGLLKEVEKEWVKVSGVG